MGAGVMGLARQRFQPVEEAFDSGFHTDRRDANASRRRWRGNFVDTAPQSRSDFMEDILA
jgi:hypothetical protein